MDFFYCYNEELAKYLRFTKNISFITKARHVKTNKIFYLFMQTQQLTEAINTYKDDKEKG